MEIIRHLPWNFVNLLTVISWPFITRWWTNIANLNPPIAKRRYIFKKLHFSIAIFFSEGKRQCCLESDDVRWCDSSTKQLMHRHKKWGHLLQLDVLIMKNPTTDPNSPIRKKMRNNWRLAFVMRLIFPKMNKAIIWTSKEHLWMKGIYILKPKLGPSKWQTKMSTSSRKSSVVIQVPFYVLNLRFAVILEIVGFRRPHYLGKHS